MSLPDEIFGVRQAPLKPLYGGNAKLLRKIDEARQVLKDAVEDSIIDDWVYDDRFTLVLDILSDIKRELS